MKNKLTASEIRKIQILCYRLINQINTLKRKKTTIHNVEMMKESISFLIELSMELNEIIGLDKDIRKFILDFENKI